ncbi:MAG: hypothetical protein V4582_15205 [Pseudomonadota bacterium]
MTTANFGLLLRQHFVLAVFRPIDAGPGFGFARKRRGYAQRLGRWQIEVSNFGNVWHSAASRKMAELVFFIVASVSAGAALGVWFVVSFMLGYFGRTNSFASSCARSNPALKADWPDAAQAII